MSASVMTTFLKINQSIDSKQKKHLLKFVKTFKTFLGDKGLGSHNGAPRMKTKIPGRYKLRVVSKSKNLVERV